MNKIGVIMNQFHHAEDGEGFPFKLHDGQALSSEAAGPAQKLSLNSKRKEATGST